MIEEVFENKTGVKHFDICLMNPPYDKSLHLKFLEKVIEVTDKVVTVQPVRWIEETVGPKKKTSAFNKYEDSIAKHIKELDIYSAEEAEKLFGAAFNFNIGIYVCDKKGGFDYSKLNTNKILDKVLEKMPDNIDNHIKFNEPNNAIIVSLITGGNNGRNNVIDLYFQGSTYKSVIYDGNSKRLDNGLTFYENRKKTAWGNVKVRGEQFNIKFKNIDECINFFNSTRTYLFRYIFNVVTSDIHVQAKFLPFMNDYSKPWTDERMYDYFNITKEEQKEIEERVDKIYNEIQQRIEEENRTKTRRKKMIEQLEKKTGVKKFDICLVNPPYDGNLHLKFLEKIIEVCNITINISPSDRFTNINLENKLSAKLAKYIDSLEIISKEQANSQFGIISSSNLGIGVFKKNAKGYEPKFNEVRRFIKLIRKEKSIRSSINFYNDSTRKYKYWCGVQGDYGYAKSWHYSLEDVFKGNPGAKMGFNTKEELDNFIKTSTTTWPYKLMYIVDDSAAVVAHLPFMKDYTRYYDDEYFYKYFNITDDERKIIEDFIKKHYRPINRIKNDK